MRKEHSREGSAGRPRGGRGRTRTHISRAQSSSLSLTPDLPGAGLGVFPGSASSAPDSRWRQTRVLPLWSADCPSSAHLPRLVTPGTGGSFCSRPWSSVCFAGRLSVCVREPGGLGGDSMEPSRPSLSLFVRLNSQRERRFCLRLPRSHSWK